MKRKIQNSQIKSIFVPTDFSACAGYAVDAAMDFARRYGAKVHLYHCADLPWNWHTMSDSEKAAQPAELQKVANATTLLRKIEKDNPNIEITSVVSGGKLLENVSGYVKNYGIDLVVMGSHGASGKKEFFIGSNAQKVVRSVKAKVLVVKNKLKKLDFKKVVFVSSFNENEREPFIKFLAAVRSYGPEIHLLAVNTNDFFGVPYIVQHEAMKYFMELASPLVCKKHIVRDFSVDSGARVFTEEVEADLIVISNHYRHPLKRMLVGSNVEALVNHAELPVLTIDY